MINMGDLGSHIELQTSHFLVERDTFIRNKRHRKQAMIILQEMAVFNSLYGLEVA